MKTNLIKHGYEYNPLMPRWDIPTKGVALKDIPPTPIGDRAICLGHVKEENGKLKFNFPKYESVLAGWFEFA